MGIISRTVCVCVYSCNEGYGGTYCQTAAVSTLPLLVSLSTLLPIAVILVVIVTVIFISKRLDQSQDVSDTQMQSADTHSARYEVSLTLICLHVLLMIQCRLSLSHSLFSAPV